MGRPRLVSSQGSGLIRARVAGTSLPEVRPNAMSNLGHQRYRIARPRPSTGSPGWILARSRARNVEAACSVYAGAALTFWAIVRWSPADFWPVHLILYGPRWILALPALPLIALAAWRRSKKAALALSLAAVGLVPTSGLVLPGWGLVTGPRPGIPTLRLLTCNVQYGDLKIETMAGLIRLAGPDLVLFQECHLDDPSVLLGSGQWYVRSSGEFCLASRHPIVDFSVLRRPDKAYRIIAIRADISWHGETIPVVSVHLMTPRDGLEAMIYSPVRGIEPFRRVAQVQCLESSLLLRWIADAPGAILLAGDFNLTAEHPLYRRDWGGYSNAFSESSLGFGQTMMTRRIGLRIDHILGGTCWQPAACWVGPDIGSAHRPVLADLSWAGPSDDPG